MGFDTREATEDYIAAAYKSPSESLFCGRRARYLSITTRQFARLVGQWTVGIGLDPKFPGTHSLCPTKAPLIYRQTGNLRAVQLLFGQKKIESTVRYLGIEVDDALAIAEQRCRTYRGGADQGNVLHTHCACCDEGG